MFLSTGAGPRTYNLRSLQQLAFSSFVEHLIFSSEQGVAIILL